MASLESLPLDLHFHVLSFLLRPTTPQRTTHPFLALSSTSRALRASTLAYTQHTLTTLHRCAHPHSPPTSRPHPLRTLITFLHKNCTFCHHPTTSHAKLHPLLPCCRTCDSTHFPNKITLTDAMKRYNLARDNLMANVPYGQYMCFNVRTTIFLGADVERFAAATHGPLDTFLAKKAARKQKRDANKAAKSRQRKVHLAELCRANGVESGPEDSDAGDLVDIVRRRILLARISAEGGLRDRVQRLRDAGYGPMITSLHPWQQRQWGETPRNPADPLDDVDQRFPGDEALADLFMQEFAGGGGMDVGVYRARECGRFDGAWAGVARGFRQVDAAEGGAPWGMQCYPVCVKLVFVAQEGKSERWCKNAAKEIERKNEERAGQFEEVKRVYREVIRQGRWIEHVRGDCSEPPKRMPFSGPAEVAVSS